ncbi:MAG: DMT family transporter [Actinobacteria bacterium]|nr:DMT family transporter [Actinomycetota bacterium]
MAVRSLTLERSGARINPGVAALVGAMGIWGGTYVVTDAVLGAIGPYSILLLRFVIAFAVLAPFAWRAGLRPRMVVQPIFLLFGFTGMVLHLALETVGLQYTSPGSAALVIATAPAVTLVASVIFLKERLNLTRGVGIGLSVLGAALVTQARLNTGGKSELLGNLLVFAGVLAWGIYAVQGKKLSTSVPGIVSTAASAGAAALLIAPVAIGEMLAGNVPVFDGGSIAGIVFLGAGANAAAFALWNVSLKYLDASTAGSYINLVPVIGVILALLLGETMTPLQWLGGAVVMAGVWLTDRRKVRPPA